jgi:hypothetical protein
MRQLIYSLVLAVAPAVASAQKSSVDLPPQQITPSFGESQWNPPEAQVQRLVKQTYDYFSARDGKRFADAYANFSQSQKQTVPFDGWKGQLEEFYNKAGALEERRITKVTWYKNPSNAKPGIYAAVDFIGQFHNLALYCGFVAWHQQMDGSFELVREEANLVEKAVAVRMTPEMMKRARTEFRC